ncbi:MAG TPA: TspO/MBR family protein [Kiloniellales bacterium]|nr:TspO/MBR family protein [Kiloniellales bacterium]
MTLAPSRYGVVLQALGLIVLLALCLAVGWLGSLVAQPAVQGWYQTLRLPSFRPGDAAFPIVWTILYVVMAVSAWLVWRRHPFGEVKGALALFGVQLLLSLAWSYLFFGLQSPLLGLIDIVALDLAIIATIVAFWWYDRMASLLLLPYLAWVFFASSLNAWIWANN